MSALPNTAATALPPIPPAPVADHVFAAAVAPARRRTAEIVPFRQDEDVLRSFFAGAVVPAPSYGLSHRTRATLVALAAVIAGGAFVAATSQLLEI